MFPTSWFTTDFFPFNYFTRIEGELARRAGSVWVAGILRHQLAEQIRRRKQQQNVRIRAEAVTLSKRLEQHADDVFRLRQRNKAVWAMVLSEV